jgi:excisionase family DNA binding protein
MEAYLTAKEAADYLKLAERTLVRLAHEGKIPGVKIGGQWRFRRALLDEYLDTLASESVVSGGTTPSQVTDAPLSEILTVEQIIPDLKAADRNEVIHAMVSQVTELGLVKDQSWFEAALAARERLEPTAVPEGIAFLHARRRAADKFPKQFIAMARSAEGLVFGSPDMGKTHIFFLLALRNDALHLRWLSRLAWIVRSPGRLGRLLESDTAENILEVLLEGASALPASLKPTG